MLYKSFTLYLSTMEVILISPKLNLFFFFSVVISFLSVAPLFFQAGNFGIISRSWNPPVLSFISSLGYSFSYFIFLILSLPWNSNWEISRLTWLKYFIHHICLLAITLNPCWHLHYCILFPTICNIAARVSILSSPCLFSIPELTLALVCS